jgi:hypothetical protein
VNNVMDRRLDSQRLLAEEVAAWAEKLNAMN